MKPVTYMVGLCLAALAGAGLVLLLQDSQPVPAPVPEPVAQAPAPASVPVTEALPEQAVGEADSRDRARGKAGNEFATARSSEGYVPELQSSPPAGAAAPAGQPRPAKPPAAQADSGARPLRKGKFRDDFAALNAQRDEVTVLESGVAFEVFKQGDGERPEANDTVLVRYTGWLPDGRVFDSTANDPMPMSLALESIAIPGLREALLLMPAGSEWRVVIPPSQGFGRSGNNQLRRRDVIYDIELIGVEGSPSVGDS